jgi:exonuclease SbcD
MREANRQNSSEFKVEFNAACNFSKERYTGESMKILHTSDWHLGKRLGRFSRMEEQADILDEICSIVDEQNPDLIMLSGDLFDGFNPSAEAIELLYRTLHRMSGGGKRVIIAIAGNHDSPDRIESPDPLARISGIFFLGYPETRIKTCRLESGWVVESPEAGLLRLRKEGRAELRIIATPYAGEVRLRKAIDPTRGEEQIRAILRDHWKNLADRFFDDGGINLMTAHLFSAEAESLPFDELEEEGERPILHPGGLELIPFSAFPKDAQYVALGHLHRPMLTQYGRSTICYSGSPLAYSLSESGQQKQVVLVDLEPGKAAKCEVVPLCRGRALCRGRFKTLEKALAWLGEHQESYVEVTMEVDHYLETGVRDAIHDAHPRVLAVVPELLEGPDLSVSRREEIDIDAPLERLFTEYFRGRNNGADPEPYLLELLAEAVSAGNEEPGV